MTDTAIKLISATQSQNDYGVLVDGTPTEREVAAKIESVTRAEFFAGGQNRLNPQFVFTIFAAEWQGERVISYNSTLYSVYREYYVPGTDYLELYVEQKGGINAAQPVNGSGGDSDGTTDST